MVDHAAPAGIDQSARDRSAGVGSRLPIGLASRAAKLARGFAVAVTMATLATPAVADELGDPRALFDALRPLQRGDVEGAEAGLAALPNESLRRAGAALLRQPMLQPRNVRWDMPSVTLPIRIGRNGVPLMDAAVNGFAVEVGLDSGAGVSVLTESTAKKVGALPVVTSRLPTVRDAVGQAVPARLATVDLSVGTLAFLGLPVLVLPDDRLRASFLGLTLFAFDGLIGWNALAEVRIDVDYRSSVVSFSMPRECSDGGLRLWSVGQKPLLEIEIDGKHAIAFLDTGSRTSYLIRAPSSAPDDAGGRLTGSASGISVQKESAEPDVALSLGSLSLPRRSLPVRYTAQDGSFYDFVVGADLLRGRRVGVDAACGAYTYQ